MTFSRLFCSTCAIIHTVQKELLTSSRLHEKIRRYRGGNIMLTLKAEKRNPDEKAKKLSNYYYISLLFT